MAEHRSHPDDDPDRLIRVALLAAIEAVCAQRKIPPSRWGKMVLNDGHIVQKIKEGRLTLRTIETIQRHCRENGHPVRFEMQEAA
jgi:hypothetical protein